MKGYQTVTGEAQTEIVILKSRFIGCCKHVKTAEEASEFLTSVKKKYSDATHHCYAYVLEANSSLQKFSDDGEPQGTAGMPILDVVLKQSLTNVAVVITRYFGGVKLGGGGLVRAYSQAAAAVLAQVQKCKNLLCGFYTMSLDYDTYHKVSKALQSLEILNTSFHTFVEVEFVSERQDVETRLLDLCGGKCKVTFQKQDYYHFKIGD